MLLWPMFHFTNFLVEIEHVYKFLPQSITLKPKSQINFTMTKIANLTGFCLLCYKTTEFPSNTVKTPENIKTFVKIVKQFAEQKDNKCLQNFLKDKLIECCKKCNFIIEDFCESYNQLKLLELKLDFMLDKLVEKINHANKVPSRWINLNRVLEELVLTNLEKKAESLEWIRQLRQSVIEAGHQRKIRSQPRVSLGRNFAAVKSCQIREKMLESIQRLKILTDQKLDRNWKCQFCEKRFSSKHNLSVHLRIHTGEKPFKCRFCKKNFRFRGDFTKHLTDNHSNEKGVEKELKRKWATKPVPDELLIRDGETPLKTEVQSSGPQKRKFSTRNKRPVKYSEIEIEDNAECMSENLDTIDDMIESTTFVDHEDDNKYNDEAEFEDPDDNSNDGTVEGIEANDNNTSSIERTEDTAIFNDPLIQVKVEHQSHRRDSFITEHLSTISNKEMESVAQSLKPKLTIIQETTRNQCSKCGKILRSAYGLQVHLEYHKNPEEWKYGCKVCENKFATKYNLQNHVRSHQKTNQNLASKLSSKYLKNKYRKDKLLNTNVNTKESLSTKIGSISVNKVKGVKSNIDEKQQNRYSLRRNRVTKFTNEVDSDDDNDPTDIEYKSEGSASEKSDDEEQRIKGKLQLDRPKLKRGRPKFKTGSGAKLDIECKICGKRFSSLFRKDHHFKYCHDLTQLKTKRYYPCKKNGCTAYFLSSEQVRRHRTFDHDKTRTVNIDKTEKHLKCSQCDKTFRLKGTLVKHLEYHKDPSEWKFECEICARKFAVKYHLDHHVKLHKNRKPFKCPFCGERFTRSDKVNIHLAKKHPDADFNKDKVVNEKIIKKGEIKSASTNTDRRGISGPRPLVIECEICTRKFTSFLRKELHFKNFHDLSHITDKSKVEKCSAIGCSAYFLEKIQLKAHNTLEHGLGGLHKKPKKFKCEECGKGFISRHHLKIHLEYHKNPSEWKFECEICGKKCASEGKLMNHMRTHTKERPFQCKFCVEKFGSSSNLKGHLEKWHRDEEGIRDELEGKEKEAKRENVKIYKLKKNVTKTNVRNADEKAIKLSSKFVGANEALNSEDIITDKNRNAGNEIDGSIGKISSLNESGMANVLTKKGDSFGDGTLVEFEDLD